MKRNRIIIPVVALLSHTMYAQTPVDMNLQLQNVEILQRPRSACSFPSPA